MTVGGPEPDIPMLLICVGLIFAFVAVIVGAAAVGVW